jgi:hypothetical protein
MGGWGGEHNPLEDGWLDAWKRVERIAKHKYYRSSN